MNESNKQAKDKIFFSFNSDKENINTKIKRTFEIYLKDLIKNDKEPWRFKKTAI